MRIIAAAILLCLACFAPAVVTTVSVTVDGTYKSGTTLPVMTLSGGIDIYTITLPADFRGKPTVQFRCEGDITRSSQSAMTDVTKNFAGEGFDWYISPPTGTVARSIYITGTAGQKVWAEIKSYPGQQ